MTIGESRFRRYRDIQDAKGYIDIVWSQALERISKRVVTAEPTTTATAAPPQPSTVQTTPPSQSTIVHQTVVTTNPAATHRESLLPRIISDLRRTLEGDSAWVASVRLTGDVDLESLVSLFRTNVATKPDFTDRVNELWNVIGQLRFPEPSDEELKKTNITRAQAGSVNRMDIWLKKRLGNSYAETVEPTIKDIRDVGIVRKGFAHQGSALRDAADAAAQRLGITIPMRDWAAAWDQVLTKVEEGFEAIRLEVKEAPATEPLEGTLKVEDVGEQT